MHPFRQTFSGTGLALLIGLICFGFIGCGGEDLSNPPSEIAERLAHAKNQSPANSPAAAPPPDARVPDIAEPAKPATDDLQKKPEPAQPVDTSLVSTQDADSQKAANSDERHTSVPSDTTPQQPKATQDATTPASEKSVAGTSLDRSAGATIETAVVTAGGKTASNVKKDHDSKESTAAAGMSLLDKLKVEDKAADSKQPNAKVQTSRASAGSQTDRAATSIQAWSRLIPQLVQSSLVSVSADGLRGAASAGPSQAHVMTFPQRIADEAGTPALQQTRSLPDNPAANIPEVSHVTNLPASVRAVELLPEKKLVLFGMDDGRLLARTTAWVQNHDLYAQDLQRFQDEHRPQSQLADSPVIFLRAIGPDRLLSVSESGCLRLWNLDDVVHHVISPLEMTEERAAMPEPPRVPATPINDLKLTEGSALSLCCSPDSKYCGIVTTGQSVIILDKETGELVTQLEMTQLDDTPPAAVLIEPASSRVILGLADGRVIRRAFGGAEIPQSTGEASNNVDYEVLYTPDDTDRSGAVTSLAMAEDDNMLYCGRADGTVWTIDRKRQSAVSGKRIHRGPVTVIRIRPDGLVSVGVDRTVKLNPTWTGPDVHKTQSNRSWSLPRDDSVRKTTFDPDEDTSSEPNRFTQKRVIRRAAANSTTTSQAAVRAADPVSEMYQHRLRLAVDEQLREDTRRKLFEHRDSTATAASVSPTTIDSASRSGAAPELAGDVATNLDYSSRPARRTLMSISEDGLTVAVGQSHEAARGRTSTVEHPVVLIDLPTGTILRHWKTVHELHDLTLATSQGLLLPTPLSSRLSLVSGEFLSHPFDRCRKWARQPNTALVATGLEGRNGVASGSVISVNMESLDRKVGVNAYEAVVPAIAFSADGSSLFVSLREKTTMKLLELDPETLQIRSELSSEPVSGAWDPQDNDPRRARLGVTHIIPSVSGRYLLTYGNYPEGDYQIRIWKRSVNSGVSASETVNKWRQEDVVVVPSKTDFIERSMTSTPMAFVRNRDTEIAVIGPKGLAIARVHNGDIKETLPLEDVVGRRPVSLLSPDGRWFFAGDSAGKVHVWDLARFSRPPRSFDAHTGPIIGLEMSANGRFLATAGVENRLKAWHIAEFLEGKTATTGR